MVKALPWFSTVREKLDDPQYSGWFLKFNTANKTYNVPQCAPENPKKCTNLYHDQLQTPEVPTAKNPNPDGKCVGECDCGAHPCGEYLWVGASALFLPRSLPFPAVSGSPLS